METLFIGGPFNGKFKDVDDTLEQIVVRVHSEQLNFSYSNSIKPINKAETYEATYIKSIIVGDSPNRPFVIYRWDRLSMDDTLQLLLDNYRR